MAYDPDNFYFAFRCSDTEPVKIKSSVCKRDAIGQDDLVGVILDTFNDNQSGFTFMLNPLGIQGDGIMNVQGNVDDSHDMVWYSKGLIDDRGWTVEARVPLQSIRFPDKKALTMRVLFFRFLTRTSEQMSFPPLNPDNSSIISQAQPIQVSGLKYKRVVEILPAFTYGARYGADAGKLVRNEENKDISLTGKVGLTSDLTMDGAVNPDFSQVEADAGQVDINLRYALYYQEKRPFFLEGQDLWRFGGEMEDAPLAAVVYTRTIIDPTYGFRLTGKLSRRDTIAAIYAKDRLPGDAVDVHPDFAIVRYKHSLKEDAYIGGVLHGPGVWPGIQPRRRRRRPVPVEPDLPVLVPRFRLADAAGGRASPRTRTTRFRSITITRAGNGSSTSATRTFPGISRWTTGFLTRTGVRRLAAFAMHQIYPQSKFFQKIEPFYWSYHLYDTIDDRWETMNVFVAPVLPAAEHPGPVRRDPGQRDLRRRAVRPDRLRIPDPESQIFKQVLRSRRLIRRWGGIYYDPDAPYQGDETRFGPRRPVPARRQARLQPEPDLCRFLQAGRREEDLRLYDPLEPEHVPDQQVPFPPGHRRIQLLPEAADRDALVSFTYIPGTVFYVGYGSAFERQDWNGGEYVDERPLPRNQARPVLEDQLSLEVLITNRTGRAPSSRRAVPGCPLCGHGLPFRP